MIYDRVHLARTVLVVATACLTAAASTRVPAQLPPDSDWTANALLEDVTRVSDGKVGAGQGVSRHGDRLYVYGDVYSAKPRIGVIREYTLDLEPTGRDIRLEKDGRPLITHPTGLTWDDDLGCFLGNTVNQIATIYKIDWKRAITDGNLDRAVLATVRDDAAVNGCRPVFVTVDDKRYIATADYGDVTPEIRLYDVKSMLRAGRTKAKGVVAFRFPCGPFNQNLDWDEDTGCLTCIQNVVAGRGWRLDELNLTALEAAASLVAPEGDRQNASIVDAKGVRFRTLIFNPHDELEGFCRLDNGRVLFVTSGPKNNLTAGRIATTERYETPAGSYSPNPQSVIDQKQ